MARRRRNKAAPQSSLTESGAPRKAFDESKHRRAAGGRFGSGGGAATAGAAPRASSSVDSPVRRMHALADKMHGKPRADILAAAQAIGINRSTASTQLYVYQRNRAARELQAAATGVSSGNPREVLQAAAARALGVPPAPKAPRAAPKPPAALSASAKAARRPNEGDAYHVEDTHADILRKIRPLDVVQHPNGNTYFTPANKLSLHEHEGHGAGYFTVKHVTSEIVASAKGNSYFKHDGNGDVRSISSNIKVEDTKFNSKLSATSTAPKSTPPALKPTPAVATPRSTPPKPAAQNANRFAMRPGERPVAAFHRIADEMHDRPRSEVIATAVSAGVNRSTASVQYTQWQRNRGAGSAATTRSSPAARPAAPVAARPPAAAPAPKPASDKSRKLIKDETVHVPPAARALHERLHNAASVFKDATFKATYDSSGKITGFSVFRGNAFSSSGPRDVTISRKFTADTVDHSYFMVGSDERTTGSAKTFLAETVKAYQDHGYKKVTVHANIDVGGYAWIRYGFKPDPSSHSSMKRALDHAVSNRPEIKEALGPSGMAEVRRLADAGEFNKIAQITTPVKMRDGTSKPFGKYVFLGSDWYGSLPLKNKAAMDTFYKYAGADK